MALEPLHIVADGLTLIATVGDETVIGNVVVFVQPLAFVPVTV